MAAAIITLLALTSSPSTAGGYIRTGPASVHWEYSFGVSLLMSEEVTGYIMNGRFRKIPTRFVDGGSPEGWVYEFSGERCWAEPMSRVFMGTDGKLIEFRFVTPNFVVFKCRKY